jgi:hypothetical protein
MPDVRVCINCQRRLSDEDLLERQSERMEAARISVGLHGVCFRYYSCPRCGHDLVFLEVAALPQENDADFALRKAALIQAAQDVKARRTTVLVVEQGAWQV